MTKFLPNPVDVRRSASFNANWLECHVATMFRIWIVIDCTKCYIVSYKAIIANEDASLILKLTTAIDEYPLTDMGILSTIGIERWNYGYAILKFLVHRLVMPKPHTSPCSYATANDCHHQQCSF